MSRHKLTPEIQASICTYLRAGGFPHVAAEAAGVPRQVFELWLRRGRARKPRRKYRLFVEAVAQAQAQVRLLAEMAAYKKDPLTWLKSGPGKETPDNPGWTNPGKNQAKSGEDQADWLLTPRIQELLAELLRALAPFPQAREAVAQALADSKAAQAAAPSP